MPEDLATEFARHERAIRRFCARELRSLPPEIVEDTVQDVLVVAWERRADYRGEGTYRAWLFGIAAHTCANVRRKRRDVLTEDGVLDPAPDEGEARTAFDGLRLEEREDVLRAAIDTALDPTDREIAWLRYALDAALPDIATDCGLPTVDAARVALQRIRRRLDREIRARLHALGHTSSFVHEP